jgi:hypothetical protein
MGNMRNRLCQQTYAAPYTTSAKAFTFVLQGNAAKIASDVTKPALASDYKPATLATAGDDLFALSFVHYDVFGSGNPAGKFSYNESALFNVVEDTALHTKHLFISSLYLDSSAAVTSGRDFFGFPKSFGAITVPNAPSSAMTLSTKAEVVSVAANVAGQQTMYSVAPGGGAATVDVPALIDVNAIDLVADSLDLLLKSMGVTIGGDLVQLFRMIAYHEAPLVLLKQMPSAETPAQAAYQSYVVAKAQVTNVRKVSFLTGFNVTVNDWLGAPIATSYGLTPGVAKASPIGFYIDADAEIKTVRETVI